MWFSQKITGSCSREDIGGRGGGSEPELWDLYCVTYSFIDSSHSPGTHCIVSIIRGTADRTVKEVDAISLLVELIVSPGMYLGLFFKKNWVFRRTHCGQCN